MNEGRSKKSEFSMATGGAGLNWLRLFPCTGVRCEWKRQKAKSKRQKAKVSRMASPSLIKNREALRLPFAFCLLLFAFCLFLPSSGFFTAHGVSR